MNTIQIIENSRDEFDEKFSKEDYSFIAHGIEEDRITGYTIPKDRLANDEIKSHITTLLTNIAKSEIEQLGKNVDFDPDNYQGEESEGYNVCVSEQITHWKEILNNLTK